MLASDRGWNEKSTEDETEDLTEGLTEDLTEEAWVSAGHFVAVRKHRNMAANQATPGHWVQSLQGAPGTVLAFAWGFAEGTLFFVVPDVLFTLTAMFRPRRSLVQISAAVAGAVIAGWLMFCWAANNAPGARSAVARVPFVRTQMIEKVERDFRTQGAGSMLIGPLSGIPYKIYAVQAPAYTSLPVFLLMTVPARIERFIIVWTFFSALGAGLNRTRFANPRSVAAIHAALWVCFYSYYWSGIW